MGTYQVTWLQLWLQQEIRNTFYYVTTQGEPTNAEWVDCVDEIRADFGTVGITNWSENWQFYGINRRRVDSAGLLSFLEIPTSGALVGTGTSDDVATQVALLISNKGTTVKPNRARSYLGGFMAPQMAESVWGGGLLADMEELIDYQSDLNAGGTNPLQRVSAQWNSGHTMVVATNDLSGAVSVGSEVPATQRRRRLGRGI
jgi:hypothetical protein